MKGDAGRLGDVASLPASVPVPEQPVSARAAIAYEQFVDAHVEEFRAYLKRVLDRQAEGRGGRIGVEDTLQDGLLRIYQRWPTLEQLPDDERNRRLYRHLRDAAGKALRDVYGERRGPASRPRLISFDFDSLDADGDDRPSPERELAAAVLGSMVRDIAEAAPTSDARAMVNRGVLIAGLQALTGREAVVLIAVDHLGWDQQQLAQRLGCEYVALRQTLFYARHIFYTLVRHATGLEVDDEERAQLAAYRAGELTGAQKRSVARHLKHCHACQALDNERRVFGHNAAPILAPLPFLSGAGALAKRSTAKTAAIGSAGPGLFAQPGAAKAAAVVMGILAFGGGGAAFLAAVSEQPVHRASRSVAEPRPAPLPYPTGMQRVTRPTPTRTASGAPAHPRASRANRHPRAARATTRAAGTTTGSASAATVPVPTVRTAPSGSRQAIPPSSTAPSPQRNASATGSPTQGCEFFCG